MGTAVLILIMVSSTLLFMGLFSLLSRTDKKLEKRLEHYLEVNKGKPLDTKTGRKVLNIQLALQKGNKNKRLRIQNKNLEAKLSRAGLDVKPEEFLMFQGIAIVLGAGVFYLAGGHVFAAVPGAMLGYMIPRWHLKRKQLSRITDFNDGLPDMISTIIGSLRAGFSFQQALKTVSEEAESPVKEEIEIVLKEMQYGKNIEEALYTLHDRMPSEDLELMIQAILIQRQVGGNLASVLEKIVETIRDRTKIQRQIKTLTAQGRLSGMVIGLLPVILGGVLYVIEPDYIGALFRHPIGMMMVSGGVVSSTAGFIMIRKLTMIEV
ncbi:type II secretion system F family protein [Bacillus marinisedimentorum]|uniref:type II secretion system F family protein n=1 Tax=Bacillus marinisedimentorum TaxID=1821260 RepID=UPI0008731EC5|nr:type II secretion system F family protein [Bacillus marinisedimentorum]